MPRAFRSAREILRAYSADPRAALYFVTTNKDNDMLRWALLFLVLALVAGVLGFTSVAGQSMYIARILFFVFLVVFLAGLIYSLLTGRRLPAP